VVLRRRPEPVTTAETSDEFEALAETMERHLRAGDYEAVLRASDAAARRGFTEAEAKRLEPMRAEARRCLLQTLYVDGLIRVDRERVAAGEPVTGEVLLVNLSSETARIFDVAPSGARGAAGARTTLHFEVRSLEQGADGTVVRDVQTWSELIGRDLEIPPGGRQAFPLRLDREERGGVSLRTYEISASLYPAELRVGAESIVGVVRFKPRTVRVFPRNYEHLAEDPVGRLVEAIRKNSPAHIPLCAALAAPSDRDRALGVLRRALTGEAVADAAGPSDTPAPETQVACCVAAAVLTGEILPAEPARWAERLEGRAR